jgi:hypothetical protein
MTIGEPPDYGSHPMGDVRLAALHRLNFTPIDYSSVCSVFIDVSPGPVNNTFWMRLYHDDSQVKEVLIKLPSYHEGEGIQL